jgi:hypothetical protein
MITITITPTEEELDAIEGAAAAYNATLDEESAPLDAGEYIERVVNNAVQSWTRTAYEAAVKRLGEGAAKLPYKARRALIDQVEKQIGKAE